MVDDSERERWVKKDGCWVVLDAGEGRGRRDLCGMGEGGKKRKKKEVGGCVGGVCVCVEKIGVPEKERTGKGWGDDGQPTLVFG